MHHHPDTSPAAPAAVLINLPQWDDADFIGALLAGHGMPLEFVVESRSGATASLVRATLALRGYTVTVEQHEPMRTHARTIHPSAAGAFLP